MEYKLLQERMEKENLKLEMGGLRKGVMELESQAQEQEKENRQQKAEIDNLRISLHRSSKNSIQLEEFLSRQKTSDEKLQQAYESIKLLSATVRESRDEAQAL
jgi:hypothetical protein